MNTTRDSPLTIEKLKLLLTDIASKNEDLHKENSEINTNLLSLIKLLKFKDDQLTKIKHSLLKTLIIKKHILLQSKLLKAFSKLSRKPKTKPIRTITYTDSFGIYLKPKKNYISFPKEKRFKSKAFLLLSTTREHSFNMLTHKLKKESKQTQTTKVNNQIVHKQQSITIEMKKPKNKLNINKLNINILSNSKKTFKKCSMIRNGNFSIVSKDVMNLSKNIENMIKMNYKSMVTSAFKVTKENDISYANVNKSYKKDNIVVKQNNYFCCSNNSNNYNNGVKKIKLFVVNCNQINVNAMKKVKEMKISSKNNQVCYINNKVHKSKMFIIEQLLPIEYTSNTNTYKKNQKNKNNIATQCNININLQKSPVILNITSNNKIEFISIKNVNNKQSSLSLDKLFQSKSTQFQINAYKPKNKQIIKLVPIRTYNIELSYNKSIYDKLSSEQIQVEYLHTNTKTNTNRNVNVFEPSNTLNFTIHKFPHNKTQLSLFKYNFHIKSSPSLVNTTLKFIPFYKALIITEKLKYHFTIQPKLYLLKYLTLTSLKSSFLIPITSLKTYLFYSNLHQTFYYKTLLSKQQTFYSLYINHLNLDLQSHLNTISTLEQTNRLFEDKISEFQITFNEYDKSTKSKLEQNDRQYKQTIMKLTQELKEKTAQYEKLKQLSNESTKELINTNNEFTQQKNEIQNLNEQLNSITNEYESAINELNSKDEQISKLKNQLNQFNKEYETFCKKKENEIGAAKAAINEYETQLDNMSNQIGKLSRENQKIKAANEDLLKCNDELTSLVRNAKNYEIENATLKTQNEQFKMDCDDINKKYLLLKKEYEQLKELSEENKNDLIKALEEMESYSEYLQALEMKIKEAEDAKMMAENERDNAFKEVKTIRQRYINILGENNNK